MQQDQLCIRVNEWPRGFWVTWKLRCTMTQISACLERRTCREKTQTSQSCTLVKRLGLWSQMSRAWSLTPPLTEQESSFRDSVLFPLSENGNNDISPTSQKVVRIKPVKVSEALTLKGIVCPLQLALYVLLIWIHAPIQQILLDLIGLEPG